MKRTLLSGALALTLCLGWYAMRNAQAETEPLESTSTLMQRKLVYAKEVLDGLVLEDFDAIKVAADEMSLLSLEASWLKGGDPDYARHNAEFHWGVEGLAKMADEENLEGATMKYAQIVITCVECHKTVRRVRRLASTD